MSIDKAQTNRLFDLIASRFDKIGTPFFTYYGKALAEIAGIDAGANVLDVACGIGSAAFPAAELTGPEGKVIATDFSAKMIEECEKTAAEILKQSPDKLQPVPDFRVMDAEMLEFPGSVFDRVLCGFGLFFFPDPLKGLREIYRVLKPGGKIAFTTWNDEAKKDWMVELLKKYIPGMTDYYEIKSGEINAGDFGFPGGIDKILKLGGFEKEVIIKENCDTFYDSPEDWIETRWHTSTRKYFEQLSGAQYINLKNEIIDKLKVFEYNGRIRMPLSAWMVRGRKPL